MMSACKTLESGGSSEIGHNMQTRGSCHNQLAKIADSFFYKTIKVMVSIIVCVIWQNHSANWINQV